MINLLRWIARIGGLCAFILGLMLSRLAPAALQTHMVLGSLVAVALAILGAWAMAKSVSLPIARMALIWAGATIYVGVTQTRLMMDSNHWIIEVLHALLGIGAIGFAEMLGAALTRKSASLAK
jgi:hypothetical protein